MSQKTHKRIVNSLNPRSLLGMVLIVISNMKRRKLILRQTMSIKQLKLCKLLLQKRKEEKEEEEEKKEKEEKKKGGIGGNGGTGEK